MNFIQKKRKLSKLSTTINLVAKGNILSDTQLHINNQNPKTWGSQFMIGQDN